MYFGEFFVVKHRNLHTATPTPKNLHCRVSTPIPPSSTHPELPVSTSPPAAPRSCWIAARKVSLISVW